MKTCFKCKRTLPIDDFYRHPMMGDGHLGKCKECTKRDVRENYTRRMTQADGRAKERRRGREKYARLYHVGPNWQSPDAPAEVKTRARNALSNAVRDGRIRKPSRCTECGAGGRIHGHHIDYYKPLAVRWLCSTCHRRAHAPHPDRVKPSAGPLYNTRVA